ncbi:MAG TPA: GGDEF domain-containing protein, partial [Gaiellaceae bacterium]|nr:GGDEF domain-containing protein [Gaiellaceae bacterium]
IVFALDRNARAGNEQEAATQLDAVARVSAAALGNLRANLRAQVGQVAASLPLQRALVAHDDAAVRAFARAHHVRVEAAGRSYGLLAPVPHVSGTAQIAARGRLLARVTGAVAIDKRLIETIETTTPMPPHATLLFVRKGHVIAGGPRGAIAQPRKGRLQLASLSFSASAARVARDLDVVAIEPQSAIDARITPYRRRLFLIAALTLALAAGFATRLARPVARVLADLARLSRQAQTDALTNIANRRALDERLDYEVDHARRLGTSVSFVIADIDNFKSINDRFGHQTGDEVLRRVARVFANSIRELDLAGRFGGEEIALVLPGTQLMGGRRLADRIRESVEALDVVAPSGEQVPVTASFGVAAFPTHESVEVLVAAADKALYEAKQNGKNRVETATAAKKRATLPTREVPAEA